MAMLAEPRRKVRYTINPTGKNWTQQGGSGSVFGQKMLHSMGWREGQGLGKDGQGAPEPVQVKRKSDQRGVGCSSAYAAETMPQSVDFASLLSQLNADHGGGGSVEGEAALEEADKGRPIPAPAVASVSLEAKSRASRARLHYHKFTRGKDVSAYDTQSLACIFGSRNGAVNEVGMGQKLDNAKQPEVEDDDSNTVSPCGFGFNSTSTSLRHSRSESCLQNAPQNADTVTDSKQQEVQRHGLQLVQSQTSLQDYFQAKMLEIQQRRQQQQQQQQTQRDNHHNDDRVPDASDHWTSESSCSVASTPTGGLDDSAAVDKLEDEPAQKRVCFHLCDPVPADPAVACDQEEEAVSPGCYPDDLPVIDFSLFPGCAFHLVLGYPYY